MEAIWGLGRVPGAEGLKWLLWGGKGRDQQGLEVRPELEQSLGVQPGMRFPLLPLSCFDSGFQARNVSGGFQGSPWGCSRCLQGCSHPRGPTEGFPVFLTLIPGV